MDESDIQVRCCAVCRRYILYCITCWLYIGQKMVCIYCSTVLYTRIHCYVRVLKRHCEVYQFIWSPFTLLCTLLYTVQYITGKCKIKRKLPNYCYFTTFRIDPCSRQDRNRMWPINRITVDWLVPSNRWPGSLLLPRQKTSVMVRGNASMRQRMQKRTNSSTVLSQLG